MSDLVRLPEPQCRVCHCTESEPCSLITNEACVLSLRTLVCSAPRCLAEHARRLKVERERDQEAKRLFVAPIARRVIADRRAESEARRNRIRRQQRRQAA